MFGLGLGELIVIFIIALIFVGPKKLPQLAKGLGQGLREFQNATKGFSDKVNQEVATAKSEIGKTVINAESTPVPEKPTEPQKNKTETLS